ncbi:MAG: hypothetical protein HFJ29_08330 [Clostridia bacterium]|nr:hypothetical protein [Clostridia bacterium]
MKEKMKRNWTIISVVIAILTTSICMTIFITKKKGWHEDEIFSYGSSNCKYDNLLQRFAYKDSLNQLIDEKIMDENPFKVIQNIGYYLKNQEEFRKELSSKIEKEVPVWKTNEQAKEYMTVSKDEILSYWSVYYNQARDVHPPLFYMLVHLVSSVCLNHFSKYIIFVINLAFYIASCCIIHKMLKLLGKEKFSSITILLYGLSMGAISIVMFQRMYVMLTFFMLTYLYLNLKISKGSFEIDKRTKRQLTWTILLGFLTQYYFCIYAVIVALIMGIILCKNKKKDTFKRYLWCHIKAAIIGILLFPASIYHIFFSYRGVAGGTVEAGYLERLKEYLELIFYAFSIPKGLGYAIMTVLIILLGYKLIKGKRKDIILIITIPVIIFTLIIAKIAPYMNIRYLASIFPIICVGVVLIIISIIRKITNWITKGYNNKGATYASIIVITCIAVCISIYGFMKSEPQFLYETYQRRIEIAEKYQDKKMVYVGGANFNHLQDMEEFLRYHNFIITTTWELDILQNNEGLKDEKEFILNMKCWIQDFDINFQKVLEYTNAIDYELLIDDGQSRVYKVTKS